MVTQKRVDPTFGVRVVSLLLPIAIALLWSNVAAAQRRGLVGPNASTDSYGADSDTSSPFTVGTLLGLQIVIGNTATYSVRDGVVIKETSSGGASRLAPIVVALPSLVIYAGGPIAVGAIVPLGLGRESTGDVSFTAGLGTNIDFTPEAARASVGLCVSLMFARQQRLSVAQRNSYRMSLVLPPEDQNIGSNLVPAIAFGFYVAPAFR